MERVLFVHTALGDGFFMWHGLLWRHEVAPSWAKMDALWRIGILYRMVNSPIENRGMYWQDTPKCATLPTSGSPLWWRFIPLQSKYGALSGAQVQVGSRYLEIASWGCGFTRGTIVDCFCHGISWWVLVTLHKVDTLTFGWICTPSHCSLCRVFLGCCTLVASGEHAFDFFFWEKYCWLYYYKNHEYKRPVMWLAGLQSQSGRNPR